MDKSTYLSTFDVDKFFFIFVDTVDNVDKLSTEIVDNSRLLLYLRGDTPTNVEMWITYPHRLWISYK